MSTKATRSTTERDRFIGARIREARIAAGMSQIDLAHTLGTSYQQVQKYEKGSNRVTALALDRMVTVLNRPFAYFFPNTTEVRYAATLTLMFNNKEGQKVGSLWLRLPQHRRKLIAALVEELAEEQDNP